MENYNSLKILVVGDPSVGKTSLINILCQNEVKKNTSPTIGCYLDVKLYNYEKINHNYYLEFIETNNRCKHPKTREKFYKDIKGIILVHDLSNNKSYKNLWKWLKEIIHSETFKSSGFYERVKTANSHKNLNVEVENSKMKLSVPLLVVGNKADLVAKQYRINKNDITNTFNGTSVCMTSTTLDTSSISYTSNYNIFRDFYEQVIDQSDIINYSISKQYHPTLSVVSSLNQSIPKKKWGFKYNSEMFTKTNIGNSYKIQSSPDLTDISLKLRLISTQLHSKLPR